MTSPVLQALANAKVAEVVGGHLPEPAWLAMTIKSVTITTQRPRGDDPGACEIGHYKVENGFVVMCDENGRLTGKKCQLIGEDAHAVAGRLLREAWLKRADESDFNRVIEYADRGWR